MSKSQEISGGAGLELGTSHLLDMPVTHKYPLHIVYKFNLWATLYRQDCCHNYRQMQGTGAQPDGFCWIGGKRTWKKYVFNASYSFHLYQPCFSCNLLAGSRSSYTTYNSNYQPPPNTYRGNGNRGGNRGPGGSGRGGNNMNSPGSAPYRNNRGASGMPFVRAQGPRYSNQQSPRSKFRFRTGYGIVD